MPQNVQVRLLGDFEVLVDGESHPMNLAVKSRKGFSLMEFLILQRGRPVPIARLIRELWDDQSDNPENALKTMISRYRALMDGIAPGFGKCIVSKRGSYRWQSIPSVTVDVLDMLALLDGMEIGAPPQERAQVYEQIVELYQGDLYQTGDIRNSAMQVSWLHREYLHAVYAWIELMKEAEDYDGICRLCRKAIQIDGTDNQLHVEMMRAMVHMNHGTEVLREYQHVTRLARRPDDDGSAPANLGESCRQLMQEEDETSRELNSIRNDLMAQGEKPVGPFFCDYEDFKEIFNIQIRNIERLGSTIFLGVITIGSPEKAVGAIARESAMAALKEIMRDRLRRGDIVTRVGPTVYAMLLPTVNYSTGTMVMERIERVFYDEYPNRSVVLHSRIAPLGGRIDEA